MNLGTTLTHLNVHLSEFHNKMRYTIILPNNEKVTIEGDELRFDSTKDNLVVFKKEVGEEEVFSGIFPKESALVVTYGWEKNEKTLHDEYIDAVNIGMKYEYEIKQLKSRNLWQRILNL